jgi:hypothetical protein
MQAFKKFNTTCLWYGILKKDPTLVVGEYEIYKKRFDIMTSWYVQKWIPTQH